ncbi:hypothetical protein MACK_000054 [Theileria orientalis]|uniref:Uncharacterized protein n=1 Tax=Theileria orientalis TaxID=68886 RepID=A0A976QTP5_THEOR|nr:hypothetical protein MACK_000054 [Theileria orientalis]
MRFIDMYKLLLACVFVYYTQKVTGSNVNFDAQNLKLLTSEDGTLTNSNIKGSQRQLSRRYSNSFNHQIQPEDYLDVSYVTVITGSNNNNSNNRTNDTAQYTIEEHPLSFYIIFNPGVKCLEVSYANNQVWTYYDDQETRLFPTELFFQRYEKRITVNFRTMYTEYEYYNGEWNVQSQVVMDHVVRTGLTIVTADDVHGTNPKTNDTTKYKVSTHDYVVQYVFNQGTYCTEVRLGNQKVWKYKQSEAQKGFPKALYFHSDLGLVFADFQDLSSLFKCGQQGCKCISNHKTDGISVSNLKIVTQDPNDDNNQSENDTTQYVRKDEGYGYVFQMNKSARCTEVKYKNKLLWNYGYKSGDEYPEALFFNSYFRMIVLKFSSFQLIFMGLDKWRYITKPDLDPLSESDITLYTRDENSYVTENDRTQYELVKYPYNMALLYNLNPGSRCEQLKFKGRTVWKHNPARLGDNYPTTIYVNRNMQLIMISGETFFYVYGNLDKWREVFRTIDKGAQRGGFDKAGSGNGLSLHNEYNGELDNKSDTLSVTSENSVPYSEDDDDDLSEADSDSDSDDDDDDDDDSDDDDEDDDARSDISEEESVFSSRGTKPARRGHTHYEQLSGSYMEKHPTRPSRQSPRRAPPSDKELYRLPNEEDDDEDDDDDDDDDDEDKPRKPKTPEPSKTTSGKRTALMVSIMLLLLAAVVGGIVTTFIMVKKRRSRMLLENQKVTGSNVNFDAQNLKLLTSEDGTLTNSSENDQTKYTETSHSAGTQFTFNTDVKCLGVKYNGHIFWVHRTPEHGNDYPTSVFLDNQDHDVTVFFGNLWYYTYKLQSDKYSLESSKKPLAEEERPQEVQLFDANGDNGQPQNQLPGNKYHVISYYKAGEPKQVYYYFEENCGMVQCKGAPVWKHTSQSGYPISMSYLNDEMIFEFDNGFEVYKRSNDAWELSRSSRPSQQDDQQDQDGQQQGESDASLRGTSSDGKDNKAKSEKPKRESSKFPDALADALVLVLMLSIIATVMVVLVLLMSVGLTFFINKRAKSQTLMSGRVDYV